MLKFTVNRSFRQTLKFFRFKRRRSPSINSLNVIYLRSRGTVRLANLSSRRGRNKRKGTEFLFTYVSTWNEFSMQVEENKKKRKKRKEKKPNETKKGRGERERKDDENEVKGREERGKRGSTVDREVEEARTKRGRSMGARKNVSSSCHRTQ